MADGQVVGVTHPEMANAIRVLAMDAVEAANSGHPGMPMGMADVATVLFTRFLKFDPAESTWPDRDRFVLSAGHGSMLLYSLLYLTGYPDMTMAEIKRFRQLGAKTAGHPEYGHAQGIDTTTGYMNDCSDHPLFSEFRRPCANAAVIKAEQLHLPVHPRMDQKDLEHLAESLRSAIREVG